MCVCGEWFFFVQAMERDLFFCRSWTLWDTQRTLPYKKYYDESKSSELLRRSVFSTPPQIYYAMTLL